MKYVDNTRTGKPNLVSEAIDISNFYGNMNAYNIAETITISLVDTFYQITPGLTAGLLNGMTFQNARELKIATAGTYIVVWSMSLHALSSNQEFEGTFMKGGVAQTAAVAHAEVINSGQPTTISGSGIISLAVNDLISMCIANHTGASNAIIDDVTCSVMRIGA